MEVLVAVSVGILVACAVYLLLRARSFSVVFGLVLLSYGTNLFLFAMGRLNTNQVPLTSMPGPYTDPLPQALVLTAIVIGFAMTAFVVVLALRARGILGSDKVDEKGSDV
jgi:multicomponent K+:H+ antiporter subunit C